MRKQRNFAFTFLLTLFSASKFCNGLQENLYVLKTNSLPEDENFLPTLANGHIGFTLFSKSVYMNGLYNGEKGLSHRASIPNYANIKIANSHDFSQGDDHQNDDADKRSNFMYRLDTYNGLFEVNIVEPVNGYEVRHFIYPHRYYSRAIVNLIKIHRHHAKGNITVQLIHRPDEDYSELSYNNKNNRKKNNHTTEEDIEFNSSKVIFIKTKNNDIKKYKVYTKCGNTMELEDKKYQKAKRELCVLWNHVPEEITLKHNKNMMSFKFLMTMDGNFHVAKQEMADALNDADLHSSHKNEWNKFWQSFDVHTEGNPELELAIHSSLYYLVSSLPSVNTNLPKNLYYGLSPTGLGRGGKPIDYEGHNFWDTEIWMFPVVNLIDSNWSKSLLDYRFNKLKTAKNYANQTGFQGARYPWESAYTGVEVTQPCCPEVATFQHHITADISFAIRNYLSASLDMDWMEEKGCELASEIAKFWANRAEFNKESGYYDIRGVMGPDEDHKNITNNVYTNVVAGYALYFAEFTNCLCESYVHDENYVEIAKHLKLEYDQKNDYHPQFENYEIGTMIKQADAVLLGYPLEYQMDFSTRQNDLRIYENVTRKSGPAMTWAIHAINHLDVREYIEAEMYFNRSYMDYITAPFNVWNEVEEGEIGASNFITGAGGFLQTILNGFSGIRLHLDRFEIKNVRLPPNTDQLIVKGINYLGSKFLVRHSDEKTTLKCIQANLIVPLVIEFGSNVKTLCNNCSYNITKKTTTIRAKSSLYHHCDLPVDKIGIKKN